MHFIERQESKKKKVSITKKLGKNKNHKSSKFSKLNLIKALIYPYNRLVECHFVMDDILAKLALHTATFVGKTAFTYTANYAMKKATTYINHQTTTTVTKKSDLRELERVKVSLDANIRIVQPSIDLIEIISTCGNTFIEPAVAQAVQLRKEIDAFANRVTAGTLDLTEVYGDALVFRFKTISVHRSYFKLHLC